MKNKLSSRKKLIIAFIDAFIIISLIMPVTFAAWHPILATIAKLIITGTQVLAAGFFTVKLTAVGIQYFTETAAKDKAECKKKMEWTLFYAVLTYLAIFLFSHAVGL